MRILLLLSLLFLEAFGQYDFTFDTIVDTTTTKGLKDSKQNTYLFGSDSTITFAKYSSDMKPVWSKNNTVQIMSACFSSDESVIYAAGSSNGYASILKIDPENGKILKNFQYGVYNTYLSKITLCGDEFICVAGLNSSRIAVKPPFAMKLRSADLTIVWEKAYNGIGGNLFSSLEYHSSSDRLFALGTSSNNASDSIPRNFLIVEFSMSTGQDIYANIWPQYTCVSTTQVQMLDTAIATDGIVYLGYTGVDPNTLVCNLYGITVAGKLKLENLQDHVWQYKQFNVMPSSVDIGEDSYTYFLASSDSKTVQMEALESSTGHLKYTTPLQTSTTKLSSQAIRVRTDIGKIVAGSNQVITYSNADICLTSVTFPAVAPSSSPDTPSASDTPSGTSNSSTAGSPVSNMTTLLVSIAAALCTGITIAIGLAVFWTKRKSRKEIIPGRSVRLIDSSEMAGLLANVDSFDNGHQPESYAPLKSQMFVRSVSHDRKLKSNQIDYSEISIGHELGRGAFGIVYKGRWRNTDCVVKQMDAEKSCDENAVKLFLKETLNVQNIGNHPNVCTIFGVCTDPMYPICIVMEFVPGGSLDDLLYHHKIEVDAKIAIEFGLSIASGMSHLHRENVLHCDLAARNLLVSQNEGKYVLKVSDFGLAKITEGEVYDVSKSPTFPIRWTAPESLRGHKISRASDVWSFGVVLWEIVECQTPYPGMSNMEVVNAVCDQGYRLPKPERIPIPDALYQLMLQCWATDPADRPSFNDIYQQLEDMFQQYQPIPVSETHYSQNTHSHHYNNNNNNNTTYGRDEYDLT